VSPTSPENEAVSISETLSSLVFIMLGNGRNPKTIDSREKERSEKERKKTEHGYCSGTMYCTDIKLYCEFEYESELYRSIEYAPLSIFLFKCMYLL
jgi:hypothetical protein